MIEIRILIPLSGNDGVTFTQEHHRAFEAVLLDHFGGFSRVPGATVGGWRDAAGKVYNDYSVAYIVAVASITGTSALAKIVGFAKGHYAQEAIYIAYLGLSEIL